MEHDLLLVRETLVHDVMREQPNFDPREHTSLALQAFRRIVEQFETLRNFAEACCEIIERSRNPVEEIAGRLDDVRAIAYPAKRPS